jgi:hypothetical protein
MRFLFTIAVAIPAAAAVVIWLLLAGPVGVPMAVAAAGGFSHFIVVVVGFGFQAGKVIGWNT